MTNNFHAIYKFLNNGSPLEKYNTRPKFPVILDIELTNYCNFTCRMCETGMHTSTRKQGYMSDDIYMKILDEIAPHKTAIRFIRWGEPTLHPKWRKFMKMAKEKGLLVHFNTNGSLLAEEDINFIIEIKIDSIKFSFQGASRESYHEMRNIDFYDELLLKIKTLRDKRGDSNMPYIQISTTCTSRDSVEERESFLAYAQNIADYVNIGVTDLSKVKVEKLQGETRKKLESLSHNQLSLCRPKSCSEVFAKLSVDWDGTVVSCCQDNNALAKIGNVEEKTLSELWQSEAQQHIQKLLSQNQFEEHPLCKQCFQCIEGIS